MRGGQGPGLRGLRRGRGQGGRGQGPQAEEGRRAARVGGEAGGGRGGQGRRRAGARGAHEGPRGGDGEESARQGPAGVLTSLGARRPLLGAAAPSEARVPPRRPRLPPRPPPPGPAPSRSSVPSAGPRPLLVQAAASSRFGLLTQPRRLSPGSASSAPLGAKKGGDRNRAGGRDSFSQRGEEAGVEPEREGERLRRTALRPLGSSRGGRRTKP